MEFKVAIPSETLISAPPEVAVGRTNPLPPVEFAVAAPPEMITTWDPADAVAFVAAEAVAEGLAAPSPKLPVMLAVENAVLIAAPPLVVVAKADEGVISPLPPV